MKIKKYRRRQPNGTDGDVRLNLEDISAVYFNDHGITTIVLQCGLEFHVNESIEAIVRDLEGDQNGAEENGCCGRDGGCSPKRDTGVKVDQSSFSETNKKTFKRSKKG